MIRVKATEVANLKHGFSWALLNCHITKTYNEDIGSNFKKTLDLEKNGSGSESLVHKLGNICLRNLVPFYILSVQEVLPHISW